MCIVTISRQFPKSPTVVVYKARHELVGGIYGADTLQSELLHQQMLKREMSSFDATLGAGGIGT